MKHFGRLNLLACIVGPFFLTSSIWAQEPVVKNLPKGLSLNPVTKEISGTPQVSGTFNVTISAANGSGIGSAILVLIVRSPYGWWQNRGFTTTQLADPKISGDTAAPAGDRITNLMKYALNVDPMSNGTRMLPVVETKVDASNNTYLTLAYTQLISAPDITYTVEVSGDLKTWNSGAGFTSEVSATDNPDGVTRKVVVQDLTPASGTTNRFMRLSVARR